MDNTYVSRGRRKSVGIIRKWVMQKRKEEVYSRAMLSNIAAMARCDY